MATTYNVLSTVDEGSISLEYKEESSNTDAESNDDNLNGGEFEHLITEDTPFISRVYILLQQAIPVILCFSISIASTFITQYYAGHMEIDGDKTVIFAGVTLALMFFNVTCRSFLIGISSAVG